MPSIALDESGSLADSNDLVIAIAWISEQETRSAKAIIARAWRKFTTRKEKRKPIGEFKFHRVEEQDRRRVLNDLAKTHAKLGVLIVEKDRQTIPDTPENYGILVIEAIASAQEYFGTGQLQIILDRHFSRHKDRDTLTALLMDTLDLSESPTFADSHTSPLVQLADFVAGAYHAKYRDHANSHYTELILGRVVVETHISWKDLKAKWIERLPTRKR